MWILDSIARKTIVWYKKTISPNKGFSCAYRVLYRTDSCSSAVLEIIQTKGLIAGSPDIVNRFIACHQSANVLRSQQRLEFDCGISGCFDVGGAEGCFSGLTDLGGGAAETGATSGCGCNPLFDFFALFTGRRRKRNAGVFVVLISLAIVFGYFTYGNKITDMELKLVQTATEDSDRNWGLVKNSELPDYQVLLTVEGIGEISSVTEHNSSAVNWLQLEFSEAFNYQDIKSMSITNRQLFSNKELEVFSEVHMRGEGEHFQYRLIRRWSVF